MQKNTIKEMQKIKQERREFKVSQLVEKIEKEGWEELHFPALKITERESRASISHVEEEEDNVEYDV
jgi:uroporphyrinogen-III synthase